MVCSSEKRYLREVEKNLMLPRSLRHKLMAGLRREFSENPDHMNCLESPAEMAALLLEQVSPDIKSPYQRRHHRRIRYTIVGMLVLFLFLLFLLGYLLHLGQYRIMQNRSKCDILFSWISK